MSYDVATRRHSSAQISFIYIQLRHHDLKKIGRSDGGDLVCTWIDELDWKVVDLVQVCEDWIKLLEDSKVPECFCKGSSG